MDAEGGRLMLRIGEFSKLAKISIKALRYYDKIGLLKPAMIDSATQYRYYIPEQLQTVRLISMYKEAGLSVDMITKLVYQKGDGRALLEYQRQMLTERAEEIQKALGVIELLLGGQEGQRYTASIKQVEKRLVYCCRGYIQSVSGIHDFIKSCAAELKRSNPEVGFSEPDYCCVIYPDDGYRESNIFIEYAQSVDRVGQDTEILKFKEIEPITAVSVVHHGAYEHLRDAYIFAASFARANGYTLCGEPRERYIHGAWDKKEESEWVTELQLPVKEK